MSKGNVLGWLAVVFAVCSASASPPAPPPKACTAPEFRQFDFWIGDWNVTDPKGAVAGRNVITSELDGCVLHEHWTGSKGGTGESFNIYDGATKRWHQTWVDNSGALLLLDGGLVEGRMVLTGKTETATNRITWEKLPDGRVRQSWAVSSDGGATWTSAFDGYYAKR